MTDVGYHATFCVRNAFGENLRDFLKIDRIALPNYYEARAVNVFEVFDGWRCRDHYRILIQPMPSAVIVDVVL